LISIVSPRTFARWLSGESKQPNRRSGPATPEQSRAIILRLARENGWGYTRIHGELKKLGVKVSRSTVVNILRAAGLDPGPKRGEGTWNDFIQRHAQTLWACDFFSKKVWTTRGLVDYFVLFFIHIGSRRVHIAGITANPDHTWVAARAAEVGQFFETQPMRPEFLIRDLDSKYGAGFDAAFASAGMEVIRVGPRAPNLNAHAERWVSSIKSECLDHFVVFGEAHLRYLVEQYVAHYQTERPHQGKDNLPLTGETPPPASTVSPKGIVCGERLGGLLNHYCRKVA
jgi:putative transposase